MILVLAGGAVGAVLCVSVSLSSSLLIWLLLLLRGFPTVQRLLALFSRDRQNTPANALEK